MSAVSGGFPAIPGLVLCPQNLNADGSNLNGAGDCNR